MVAWPSCAATAWLGDAPRGGWRVQTTEAENFDRSSLELAGNRSQHSLLAAIVATGKPVVVVLINGGPIAWDHTGVAAVLEAFYPGELGGEAIVDALSGGYNPGGKLPYTNYFTNFTVRDIRNTDLAADGGVTYRHFAAPVLFPFGWGLSYTQFEYTWSMSEPDAVALVGSLRAQGQGRSRPSDVGLPAECRRQPPSCIEPLCHVDPVTCVRTTSYVVTARNVGKVGGDCVVLAFATDPQLPPLFSASPAAPMLRAPNKRLFGFERVFLAVGESKQILFDLPDAELSAVHRESGERLLVPGMVWTVSVGDVVAPAKMTVSVPAYDGESAPFTIEENEWARELRARSA
jgi:hypothetical protein